jgi:alpha-beta hydrolase superfamily lysophospholipase
VIAQAPPLGQVGVSPWLILVARVLSRARPTLALDTGTDPSAISRDAAVVHELQSDPRRFNKMTVRLGAELLDAVQRVHSRAAELRLPRLILHGTADRVALPDGSRRFAARAGTTVVELREHDGGYHNLFRDTCAAEVLADLETWLARRLGAPVARSEPSAEPGGVAGTVPASSDSGSRARACRCSGSPQSGPQGQRLK